MQGKRRCVEGISLSNPYQQQIPIHPVRGVHFGDPRGKPPIHSNGVQINQPQQIRQQVPVDLSIQDQKYLIEYRLRELDQQAKKLQKQLEVNAMQMNFQSSAQGISSNPMNTAQTLHVVKNNVPMSTTQNLGKGPNKRMVNPINDNIRVPITVANADHIIHEILSCLQRMDHVSHEHLNANVRRFIQLFSGKLWPLEIEGRIHECLLVIINILGKTYPGDAAKVLKRFTTKYTPWNSSGIGAYVNAHYERLKALAFSLHLKSVGHLPTMQQQVLGANMPNSSGSLVSSGPSVLTSSLTPSNPMASSIQQTHPISSMPSNFSSMPVSSVPSNVYLSSVPSSSPMSTSKIPPFSPHAFSPVLPMSTFQSSPPGQSTSSSLSSRSFPSSWNVSLSISRPPIPPYDPMEYIPGAHKSSNISEDAFNNSSMEFPVFSRVTCCPIPPFTLIPGQFVTAHTLNLPENWVKRFWRGVNLAEENVIFPPKEAIDEELPMIIQLACFKKTSDGDFASLCDGSKQDKVVWPEKIAIEVNGIAVDPSRRRKVPGRNPGTVMQLGQNLPLDITPILKCGENYIKVVKYDIRAAEYDDYFFCIQSVLRESEALIAHRLRDRIMSEDDTDLLVSDLLKQDCGRGQEDDIVIISKAVKASLMCPLSLQRIQVPIRSTKCKHIGCFDLKPYLHVNRRALPTWSCPICGIYAPTNDLVVCSMTAGILVSKEYEKVRVIEFDSPTSWHPSEIDNDGVKEGDNDSDSGSDGFESSRQAYGIAENSRDNPIELT